MFFTLCSNRRLLKGCKEYRHMIMFAFLWDHSGWNKEAGWEEKGKHGKGAESWLLCSDPRREIRGEEFDDDSESREKNTYILLPRELKLSRINGEFWGVVSKMPHRFLLSCKCRTGGSISWNYWYSEVQMFGGRAWGGLGYAGLEKSLKDMNGLCN